MSREREREWESNKEKDRSTSSTEMKGWDDCCLAEKDWDFKSKEQFS